MDRKTQAKILGYTSLVCTLVVWIVFGLLFVRSLPPFFFRWVNEWLAVLAAAFFFALVAVVKGSPRWIVVMFFALISFFLLWFIEMFLGASAGVSGLA